MHGPLLLGYRKPLPVYYNAGLIFTFVLFCEFSRKGMLADSKSWRNNENYA